MKKEIIYVSASLIIAVIVVIYSINFPDIDISLLGIGMHRFFFFHSAIIPALLLLLIGILPNYQD